MRYLSYGSDSADPHTRYNFTHTFKPAWRRHAWRPKSTGKQRTTPTQFFLHDFLEFLHFTPSPPCQPRLQLRCVLVCSAHTHTHTLTIPGQPSPPPPTLTSAPAHTPALNVQPSITTPTPPSLPHTPTHARTPTVAVLLPRVPVAVHAQHVIRDLPVRVGVDAVKDDEEKVKSRQERIL